MKMDGLCHRAVVSLAFAGFLTAPLRGADPATQPVSPEVAALVEKLSSSAWKDREQAQDALILMGARAVPQLQAALSGELDEEARHRVTTALVKIEEMIETGPSMITLKLENAGPKELVAEINKQIRAELLPASPDMWEQAKFTPQNFEYENASFWQVMEDLQQKFGLSFQQYGDGMRLIQGGGQRFFEGPNSISGPFVIVAQRVHRSQSVDLVNAGRVQNEFYISFMGLAEPKLRILQASSDVKIDSAVDDKGNDLSISTNAHGGGYSSGINGQWNFNARLSYPENAGTKINLLKGSVGIVLQTGYETFEVEDVLNAKNVEKTIGETRFVFKELTRNGERYSLKMSANVDANRGESWNRISMLFYNNSGGDLKLYDEQGRSFVPGSRNVNQSNNGLEATVDFVADPNVRVRRRGVQQQSPPAPPTRLVLKVPTETRTMSIPFEFKDIPIP